MLKSLVLLFSIIALTFALVGFLLTLVKGEILDNLERLAPGTFTR